MWLWESLNEQTDWARGVFHFSALLGGLSSARVWAIVLGLLFAVVAIALLVASWTRWGQTKSLTKCIALAFLAHVWLLMYAYGTRIVVPGIGNGNQGGVQGESGMLAMNWQLPDTEESADPSADHDPSEPETTSEQGNELPVIEPWQAPIRENPNDANVEAKPLSLPKIPDPPIAAQQLVQPPPTSPLANELPVPNIASESELARLMQPTLDQPLVAPHPSAPEPSEAMRAPGFAEQALTAHTMPASMPSPAVMRSADRQPVPMSYQMRLSPMRGQATLLNGGDSNTEASVELALGWLARAQSRDGSWIAAAHGAGREASNRSPGPDGEYRHNAGQKANTAMTGLALLAFLGAGNTHLEGTYKENVLAGLKYLISQQLPSGDLSGRDQVGREPTVRYARMYSHGMASLALTEAYGMTGDAALRPAIQAACQYSLNAMNPTTGGWRYEFPTNDPGDTSQFGWQAMLLTSASNNQVISLAPGTRILMQRFLDSVSTGRSGGLAAYRPRVNGALTPDHATPSMTAEAAASRLLLGLPYSASAAEETQRMLLRQLPGQSEENLYYWYYATIAMFQLKGGMNPSEPHSAEMGNAAWSQWNNALKHQLCASQVTTGPQQGSWNPTCIWGSYGGRVYSTALACMCLEVYYRYLPVYKQDQFANQWQPARR
jgi:hypothetical protein